MEKTEGFVLKSLKYGDTSVILHVYTRTKAMQSFLIKGFFTNKKTKQRHLQYPFSMLELTYHPNSKSDLHLPRNVHLSTLYIDAHSNPIKLIVMQFLAEVVFYVLKEDEYNVQIFDFVLEQLRLFDAKSQDFSEFHLLFLAQLTKFLGFYPNMRFLERPFFDLQEGGFIDGNAQYRLSEEDSNDWRKLFHLNFNSEYTSRFKVSERERLTNNLLSYYHLHVPGFREPKSLEILKQILHA